MSLLEPGTIIGDRYKIVAPLGEGGMGAVYQAEHVYMKKRVALKLLHESVAKDQDILARFEREAVAAGNIQHPNVATATDFGRLPDGTFFLVLEYVEGASLRAQIDRGPMDPERALRITRQVALAIGAAHDKGIIHRDLKPENIMLVEGEDDLVKVLDFGIAKMDDGASPQGGESSGKLLTQLGQVFGTPDYMAPEQAMGEAIDKRADFYALGVILYELLSGKRPFSGGTMTLLRDRVFKETPPELPAELEVDPAIRAVVTKLMARLASDRFGTADEVVRAIDHASFERSPTLPPSAVPSSRATHDPDTVAKGATFTRVLLAPEGRRALVDKMRGLPMTTRLGFAGAAVVTLMLMVFALSRTSTATKPDVPSGSLDTAASASGERSSPTTIVPSWTTSEEKPAASSAPPEPSTRVDSKKPVSSTKKKKSSGGIYIPPPDQWFR